MIHVAGSPDHIGGANTELWHFYRLLCASGAEVTCVATWKVDDYWRERLEGIGCKVIQVKPRELRISDGAIVVSFCNHAFLREAWRLKHCRIVWVPCMTYICDAEKQHYAKHKPFAAYVLQSHYQRAVLLPELKRYGVREDQCHLIRGAFYADEFPFQPRPHRNGDPFVVGRLSRADPQKFSPRLWEIYGRIPHVRARVMGWCSRVEKRAGKPPEWAETLKRGAEPSLDFLRSLHALVHPGGDAVENWPRFVLEAMAAGVPVITDARGGTCEMLRDGETGYLCESDDDFSHYASLLGQNEGLRMEIASRARNAVEELSDSGEIWNRWERLFGGLS